jgi:cell division septation protein DedD
MHGRLLLTLLVMLFLPSSGCMTVSPPGPSKPEATPTADIGPAVQATLSAQAAIQAAVEATVRAMPKPTEAIPTARPTEPSSTPKPADPTAAPQVVVNVDASAPPPVVVVAPGGDTAPQAPLAAGPRAGSWIVCVWCDHGSRDPLSEAERIANQLRVAGIPAAILWSSDYPSLNPGYWVTYSGVFGNEQSAAAYLNDLARVGFSGRVRMISARSVTQPAPGGQAYWTVIVGSFTSRGEADALASRLRAQGYNPLVLFSSDYASLNPGYWVTHIGRFWDREGANSAAQRLRELGFSGAYPREIRR